MNRIVKIIAVAVALVLAAFLGAAIHAATCPQTQYVDCGMCGAHVSSWWYVQDADGIPFEVCEHCYLMCLE